MRCSSTTRWRSCGPPACSGGSPSSRNSAPFSIEAISEAAVGIRTRHGLKTPVDVGAEVLRVLRHITPAYLRKHSGAFLECALIAVRQRGSKRVAHRLKPDLLRQLVVVMAAARVSYHQSLTRPAST